MVRGLQLFSKYSSRCNLISLLSAYDFMLLALLMQIWSILFTWESLYVLDQKYVTYFLHENKRWLRIVNQSACYGEELELSVIISLITFPCNILTNDPVSSVSKPIFLYQSVKWQRHDSAVGAELLIKEIMLGWLRGHLQGFHYRCVIVV